MTLIPRAADPARPPAIPLDPRPSLRLAGAAVRAGRLAFGAAGDLAQALRDGCFALEIPAGFDLGAGLTLAREFYLDETEGDPRSAGYRGFRGRADVYFDREHFQTEHVLLDRPARARHFPPALVAMCERMNELGLLVLREVLAAVGIRPGLWSRVTGGAVDDAGTHWYASSHYRPERDQLGCAPHKDTGFVTILYIEQDGLEAWVDGVWRPIDPIPGCFLVNFGGALELLTEATAIPVRAILHRVRQTHRLPGVEDRFSFAAFVNPPASGMLYRCDASGGAAPHQSAEEFLLEFNRATWNDRHDDFGIR